MLVKQNSKVIDGVSIIGRILSFGTFAFALALVAVSWPMLKVVPEAMADDSPQPALPTLELKINGKMLTAEIASTPQQRYMGLSFRQALDEDSGMLFVYPAEQELTFTMRNTLIPLSIAFISKDLVINEIHQMNVGPGQLFDAKQKAQYALEVDQGWFAANNIKVGDQIIR